MEVAVGIKGKYPESLVRWYQWMDAVDDSVVCKLVLNVMANGVIDFRVGWSQFQFFSAFHQLPLPAPLKILDNNQLEVSTRALKQSSERAGATSGAAHGLSITGQSNQASTSTPDHLRIPEHPTDQTINTDLPVSHHKH